MPLPVVVVSAIKAVTTALAGNVRDILEGTKVEVFDPVSGLWKPAPAGVGITPAVLKDPNTAGGPGANPSNLIGPTEWLRLGAPGALPAGSSQGTLIDRDLTGITDGGEIALPSASQARIPGVFVFLGVVVGLILILRS